MSEEPKSPLSLLSRVSGLLFPPLGIVLLWRGPRRLGRKVLGTGGFLLLSLGYAALLLLLLIRFTDLQIEWRGGYIPALTYKKTTPNYEALEQDRTQRTRAVVPTGIPTGTNAYWTGLFGPQRDGHYDERPILTNWPANGLRPLWRQPVGGGYSSFAIARGLAFTLEQRRDDEVVVAYELSSGREAWTNGWKGRFKEYYSEEGPRSTPTYSDGNLYALGALGELRCLEIATGRRIWSTNMLAEHHARTPKFGCSASPLVIDEKLIVLTGAGNGQSVVCYDKRNGRPIWTALDDVMGYASPILATLAGQPQLIICADTRTVGLRLEDGKLLWEYPWRVLHDQPTIAQPVVLGANQFLLSAGYFTGCAAAEVTRTESGFAARTLWQNKNLKNKFTSSIYWQGHVYGLDEDVLTCLHAATGERQWRAGRYGFGQLLLASGHLVILTGDGALALVKATPDRHQEVARFPAIHGKTWNHLAIGDGKVLVRNAVEMACFSIAE